MRIQELAPLSVRRGACDGAGKCAAEVVLEKAIDEPLNVSLTVADGDPASGAVSHTTAHAFTVLPYRR